MSPVITHGINLMDVEVARALFAQLDLTNTVSRENLPPHFTSFSVSTPESPSDPLRHTFIASDWTRWVNTTPEAESLDAQVDNDKLLAEREQLMQTISPRRSALDILIIADNLGIYDFCERQFEILDNLGSSPFNDEKRPFPLRNNDGKPVAETDPQSFSNVGTQPLLSTCVAWLLGSALEQAGYLQLDELPLLIQGASMLKPFKPYEILDRIALRKGIFTGAPDSHQRLAMHRDRLVEEGLIDRRNADFAYEIVTHTCGHEGFLPFLKLSEQGASKVAEHSTGRFVPLELRDVSVLPAEEMSGSDARIMRILRAIDDITVSIGPDYALAEPHQKITLLSKTRGDGLQGTFLVYDTETGKLAARNWKDMKADYPDQDLSQLITFGTAQDYISSVIHCELFHVLQAGGAECGLDVDPAEARPAATGELLDISYTAKIIRAVNATLDRLAEP